MLAEDLLSTFDNTVDDSQRVFRRVLKAMSEPGLILDFDSSDNYQDSSLYGSTWSVLQTLCDTATTIYLSPSVGSASIIHSLHFYTDAEIVSNKPNADFLVLSLNEWQSVADINLGSIEAPHQSATIIIQVPEMNDSPHLILSGPGIKNQRHLFIEDLTSQQVTMLVDNSKHYPCGIDFIFCAPTKIACLPRSTTISSAIGS